MNIRRIVNKALFHIQKRLIGNIVYFDSRLYMELYYKLLKKQGFKLNGKPRFIARSVRFDDFSRITLGDRLVVSMNVYFLTHDYSYTTALISINDKPSTDVGLVRDIVVGDNVFIGMNSIIMPGTKIGNNVIIGAGSVVRGEVDDFSVIVGNPAIVISDIREYAKKIKFRKDCDLIIDRK